MRGERVRVARGRLVWGNGDTYGRIEMKSNKAKSDLPPCKLTETDGNVFFIIGAVRRALNQAGQHEKAKEFSGRAMKAASYDAVLQMCFEYVDVK